MEKFRNKLRPREWGEPVCTLPYTGGARPPIDHVRENISVPIAVSGSDPLGPTHPSPIPLPMISTKGWTLDSLINKSLNFHHVRRVPASSSSLPQIINDHENSGVPLVIEDCHKHPSWPKEEFTLDSFASTTSNDTITVRNVHNLQDIVIPVSEFITKSRSIPSLAVEGEQERFYGKDANCPKRWEEWLQNAGVVPRSLLSGGPQDLLRYRPGDIETLMCYLGVGDTFTPCHKDLCASSGQNLMCHTENDGSSFWFMTESASALEVAKFFHSLGRELDHEDYVITVQELSKAPFKVYIVEQKLGDLVLVPPRSAHQVVNSGGITVKTSWSRMTLKGLKAAYHHELPIYRRVCRPEIYRVKSTIHHALRGQTSELGTLSQHTNTPNEDEGKTLVSNIRVLFALYEYILAEEYDTPKNESAPNEANSVDENITCDICGADIFQNFFECRTCVEAGSTEGGYVVCSGCYVEGRSCRCQIMQRMQRFEFKTLVDTRTEAIQAVDMYEKSHGGTFQPNNDYCDINKDDYPRVFRAALILLDNYQKNTKVCTLSSGASHTVPFPPALSCKLCLNSKRFSHILSDHGTHSVEALLHNSDGTYHEYHHGRKARLEISATDLLDSSLGYQHLAYYATHFTRCKPAKPKFMELGWYDTNAPLPDISDGQEEIGSTLVLDATVSANSGPVVVQPSTSSKCDLAAKHKKRNMAYVLVSPYSLLGKSTNSQRKRQASSLQEKCKAPQIPTTTHTREDRKVVEEVLPIERPVEPTQRTARTPHIANPVIAQVITKKSLAKHKFKKKPGKPNSIPLPSNDTTVVASTSTHQGSPEVSLEPPSLPESRHIPPSETADAFSSELAEKFIYKVGHLLCNALHLGSVNPSDTSNSSNAGPQASCSNGYPQQHNGQPQQYNGPLQHYSQYNGPPQQNNGPPQQYGTPQQYNGPPHQYNGPPQQYNGPPHQFNGPPQQYNGPPQHYDPPQQYNGPPQHYDPPQQYNGPPQHYDPQQYNGPPHQYNGPPQHPQLHNDQHPQYHGVPQDYGPPQHLNGRHPQYSGVSNHYGPPQHPHNDPSHYYGPPQHHISQPPRFNGTSHHYDPLQRPPPHHYSPSQKHSGHPQHHGSSQHHSSLAYNNGVHPQRQRNLQPSHASSYPMANQPQFHQDRPRHNQAPMQSVGKTGYGDCQPRNEYLVHSGQNKMPVKSGSFKYSRKKRKPKSPQDIQNQYFSRFNGPRPPQGPRGHNKYRHAPITSGQVGYHGGVERSISGAHERLPLGTSGEGTPSSTYCQNQPENVRNRWTYERPRSRHQQYTPNAETASPSHDDDTTSIEPKTEDTTEHLNDFDITMHDVDAPTTTTTAQLESVETPPLPVVDPTRETAQDDGILDTVRDMDDGIVVVETPTDVRAESTVGGNQGDDQNWEDDYGMEEEEPATEASVPRSSPQSAPAAAPTTSTMNPLYNVVDESMSDVTANPWTR